MPARSAAPPTNWSRLQGSAPGLSWRRSGPTAFGSDCVGRALPHQSQTGRGRVDPPPAAQIYVRVCVKHADDPAHWMTCNQVDFRSTPESAHAGGPGTPGNLRSSRYQSSQTHCTGPKGAERGDGLYPAFWKSRSTTPVLLAVRFPLRMDRLPFTKTCAMPEAYLRG